MILSFLYTANPVGLKYRMLGDLTVFVCFGPLLMQCTSLILTGRMDERLYLYSVPTALLTEGILHTNNARDIDADRAAGAVTLATVMGFEVSKAFFAVLVIGAYCSSAFLAYRDHWGCIFTLLTLPLALDTYGRFTKDATKMLQLPEDCAQMHLPFGLLLIMGAKFTHHGMSTFFAQ